MRWMSGYTLNMRAIPGFWLPVTAKMQASCDFHAQATRSGDGARLTGLLVVVDRARHVKHLSAEE
jgi:hypothetical protein